MSRSYEGKEIARLEGLHVKRTGPCGVVRTPQGTGEEKAVENQFLAGGGGTPLISAFLSGLCLYFCSETSCDRTCFFEGHS